MNYLKLIIGISTLLFFSSCNDRSFITEYIVSNNTDAEITIYFSPIKHYSITSMESIVVENINDNYVEEPPFRTDSVVIEKKNASSITYSIQNEENQDRNIFNVEKNWDEEITSKSKNTKHYKYTYTIIEDDFSSDDEKSINPAL